MALTPQEQEIVKFGKANGKTEGQTLAALGAFRQEQKKKEKTGAFANDIGEAGGDLWEGFKGIGEELYKGGEKIVETATDKDLPIAEKVLGVGAEGFRGAARAFGAGAMGLLKLPFSQKGEDDIKEGVVEAVAPIAEMPEVQALVERYNALDPVTKKNVDNALGFAEGLAEIATAGGASRIATPAVKAALDVAEATAAAARQGGKAVVEAVPDVIPAVGKAAIQKTKEFGQGAGRIADRAKEGVTEAAARADRIAQETPAGKAALENGLEERFVNTIRESDPAAAQAFKEVLDIADESPKTISAKAQPTITGGKLAAEQFDVIDKKRKAVGKQIEEATKALPTDTKVNIEAGVKAMNDVLEANGVRIVSKDADALGEAIMDGGDMTLDFSRSGFTTAQRARIKELYQLATESGENLSPRDIYRKDRLFSQLQRETKMSEIGDILVDTAEGNKSSLYSVFRDIYSGTLDDISPEIRTLNGEYRKYRTMVDDIEDSIFKTPNFNITKTTDPAEFAKVNLRRIFGEANSSPVYEAIADQMDTVARELGYAKASPKQVAEFAQALRVLYPETIPKTGFQGSILNIGDILSTIGSVGKPNVVDQRKALRALIEESLANAANAE